MRVRRLDQHSDCHAVVTYDVIVSDPPWKYDVAGKGWGKAENYYRTHPLDEIVSMGGMPDILADRGVLFLWATSPLLDDAIELLNKWGLTFRGVAFVWVKTKKTEPTTPIGAQGVRPSIVKPTVEFVLAASRVKRGRPMPLFDESVRQVILAPKREHSRKPDEVFERIEALYPDARRLEMFARQSRAGWDAWGNEATKFDQKDDE